MLVILWICSETLFKLMFSNVWLVKIGGRNVEVNKMLLENNVLLNVFVVMFVGNEEINDMFGLFGLLFKLL